MRALLGFLLIKKAHLDQHFPILVGEFQRVRDEVQEDLQVAVVVSRNLQEVTSRLLVEFVLQRDTLLLTLELKCVDGLLDDFVQVEEGRVEVKLRVFYLCEVQQIVDEVQ